MLGVWSSHAQSFLLCFVLVTTPVFVLPLALAPMLWARIFQWRLPQDEDLAFYFGRCLGGLAVAVEIFLWEGSRNVAVTPVAVAALGVFCAIMTIVHIDGAIRKIQPWTETLEIGFWFGVTLACVAFYPAI